MAYDVENNGWSINIVAHGDESIRSNRSKSLDNDDHIGEIIILDDAENIIEKSVYNTKKSNRLFRIFKREKDPQKNKELIDYRASTTTACVKKVELAQPRQKMNKHIWYNLYNKLSEHYAKMKKIH